MLVHKETMGVLDRYWTGEYRRGPDGVSVPVMEEFTMDDGFDPAEWWEIPRNGALGRKVRRCYPFCAPVTGKDGSLLDVLPQRRRGMPVRPSPVRRQRRRRRGLFQHILEEGEL